MSTTITMTLAEWQERQTRIEELEAELQTLRATREDDRLGAADGAARRLAEAFAHAIPIVQFAVASYTPRMYPGWPHAAVDALARMLPDLPGVDPMFREVAGDLRLFARQCEEWETARQDGTLQAKFLEETAGCALEIPDEILKGET